MNFTFDKLTAQQRLTLELQHLYQQYGFCQYRMSRFEEYRLYLENQSFLPSEQVITFTDLDGRLLALKPDVTLSIVKYAQPGAGVQRLYYTENVYRAARESGAYREISQMGLELLGWVDDYAKAQVILLALRSLKATGREYLLDLSHMGFVVGLLQELDIREADRDILLECLREKNAPELRRRAEAAGLCPAKTDLLCRLTGLYGKFLPTLQQAEALAGGPATREALAQLRRLYEAIPDADKADRLRLDLSMTNYISYYNGVIFRGFVQGVPHCLLAGGQYDRLMERFGKQGGAMGFALYLDELDRREAAAPELDADLLVEYLPGTAADRIAAAVEGYTAQGLSVLALAAPADPALRWGKKLVLTQTTAEEVAKC